MTILRDGNAQHALSATHSTRSLQRTARAQRIAVQGEGGSWGVSIRPTDVPSAHGVSPGTRALWQGRRRLYRRWRRRRERRTRRTR